jgi:hypothetical protein
LTHSLFFFKYQREKTSQAFRDAISHQEKNQSKQAIKQKVAENSIVTLWKQFNHNISNDNQLTNNLMNSTTIPPSFWKRSNNNNDAIEEDEFDKMIDEVMKPLYHEISQDHRQIYEMIDDVIRPLSLDESKVNTDCQHDNCNDVLSIDSLGDESIHWNTLLNENLESSFDTNISLSTQQQVLQTSWHAATSIHSDENQVRFSLDVSDIDLNRLFDDEDNDKYNINHMNQIPSFYIE